MTSTPAEFDEWWDITHPDGTGTIEFDSDECEEDTFDDPKDYNGL